MKTDGLREAIIRKIGEEDLLEVEKIRIGIAGAGGLGSNCASNMVRVGFKRFTIVDFDIVDITQLNDDELRSLATILKKIVLKLKKMNLPYNFFINHVIADKDEHFVLKLQPRSNVWAGLELGSGLVINSIPPEEAAKFYKR